MGQALGDDSLRFASITNILTNPYLLVVSATVHPVAAPSFLWLIDCVSGCVKRNFGYVHWHCPIKKQRQTQRHWTNSPFWISPAVPSSEIGVCRGGVWGLFWWREQQRQKSIFARVDGNSLPFLSRGAWLLFLSADFCRGCPLSHARIPPSLPLFWSSLFLFFIFYFTEIENQRNGPGVSHAQLGILHPPHDCAPSSNTLEL